MDKLQGPSPSYAKCDLQKSAGQWPEVVLYLLLCPLVEYR